MKILYKPEFRIIHGHPDSPWSDFEGSITDLAIRKFNFLRKPLIIPILTTLNSFDPPYAASFEPLWIELSIRNTIPSYGQFFPDTISSSPYFYDERVNFIARKLDYTFVDKILSRYVEFSENFFAEMEEIVKNMIRGTEKGVFIGDLMLLSFFDKRVLQSKIEEIKRLIDERDRILQNYEKIAPVLKMFALYGIKVFIEINSLKTWGKVNQAPLCYIKDNNYVFRVYIKNEKIIQTLKNSLYRTLSKLRKKR